MDQSKNNVIQEPEQRGNYDTMPTNKQPMLPVNIRLLDQFCRICLRQRPDLVPLLSRIQDMTVPDIFRAITGLNMTLEDTYPLRTCRTCMVVLECALDIRRNFTESYRILKTFALSKTQPLINNLSDYQSGARAKTEMLVEKMLREYEGPKEIVEPHETVPKPQEPAVVSVWIKQEPELILEPETLPSSAGTASEALKNSDELTVEETVNVSSTSKGGTHPNRYGFKDVRSKLDPNKCYICNHVFKTPADVQVHLSVHVDMIPYKCSTCTKDTGRVRKLVTLTLLHRHFRMHASAIKCPKCPHRVWTMTALYGHMQTYHGKHAQMEYTCELCGVKRVNKAALDRHMRCHKALEEGRYSCSYCDKKFKTKAHLTGHERCHTNERPYQCLYCSKSYKTASVLNRHERGHTGAKGYQCDACGKSFRAKSSLNDHTAKSHTKSKPVDGPILACSFNGCEFVTTAKLKYYQHKAKHELKFQCSQCSQRFPTGQRLKKHEYVHTGVKDFSCKQCDKRFRTKQSLDEHEVVHNNDHPYACKICGKGFSHERTLKQHLFKHSAELSFECQQCDMKFKYRSSRARHERKHKEAAIGLIDPGDDLVGETVYVKPETSSSP